MVEKAMDVVIRAVVDSGANVVLLQELFVGPYFCQSQNAAFFEASLSAPYPARPASSTDQPEVVHPFFQFFQSLANIYNVVLPISFYERGYPNTSVFFNSVLVIDRDGSILPTLYRKTHIPDGTGYSEKFYFSPGDTGPTVFKTSVGVLGIGICWDQWFPELARAMTMMGAEVLLYPTAIGSEPQDSSLDSSGHWRRVMQGHSGANMVPVVASNRTGKEILVSSSNVSSGESNNLSEISFYGSAFITDNTGLVVRDLDRSEEGYVTAEVDVKNNLVERATWGCMRDRRPDVYGVLMGKDGR